MFNQNYNRGMGQLAEGWSGAKDAYGNAIKAWEPLGGLADKYGQGRDMLFNSLGINGAEGNAAAVKAFQAGPGYEFAKNQALESATRGSLARSGGIGGNQIAAAAKLGGDYANQEFGGWQNRLTGLSNNELVARNAVAGGTAAGYGALAGGYQNNAMNQVNLGNTTASALANNNNTEANARLAANKNLWGFGMDAAKMAMGMPPSGSGGGGGGDGGPFSSLTSMYRSFNPQGQSNPNQNPTAYGMPANNPSWAFDNSNQYGPPMPTASMTYTQPPQQGGYSMPWNNNPNRGMMWGT